ncbi:hypothetical protein CPB83DRAFT_812523 [Crepidotus variabilis]|uniref:PH domain-containing protein n=1 Tax=Crepidotus variabilis TaxID=179855 RepID=A0A9P6EHZ0_9AGAR|nr:hypothetical protein CPB83DRAFT_812523 [Crepidotus variabilis]
MASRKSPLRDRLLSNSPDPIKNSILRESGMGWGGSSSPQTASPKGSKNPGTSPLRISKRDNPVRPRGPVVARRSSSSYRHVHTNNLVSKSPFKSQIPTPATPSTRPTSVSFPTRRVSGEKRPRPSSMHEQAEVENDRPFALKRERKQSKTFQELIQREPVTKSPFRSIQTDSGEEPQPPPSQISLPHEATRLSSASPNPIHMHVPSPQSSKPSPARSALVSRRMHGPRLSGGPRRERRKTVTFHERCDVLEFERDESIDDDVFLDDGTEDEVFESDQGEDDHEEDGHSDEGSLIEHSFGHEEDQSEPMDEDQNQEHSDENIQHSNAGLHPSVPSLLGDPDASITGIVDEMFASTSPNPLGEAGLMTPPRHHDIPTDLETEDGVPFGRSHHVERFLQHHQHSSPHTQQPPHFSPTGSPQQRSSPGSYPHNLGLATHASPLGPPATPPRRSPAMRHSTPPLGRSTHLERKLKAREEERDEDEQFDDLNKLPVSPSPMKAQPSGSTPREEGLVPKFELAPGKRRESDTNTSASINVDAFGSRIQDQSIPSDVERANSSLIEHDSMDPSNLSIGNSEVNLSGLVDENDRSELLERFTSGTPERRRSSLPKPQGSRQGSPSLEGFKSALSRRLESPSSRSASPLIPVKQESPVALSKSPSRERISREEVQRRLMNRRSSSPVLAPRSSTSSPLPITPVDEVKSPLRHRSSPFDLAEKEKDRMSILTTGTDFSVMSTEIAIVHTAEKRTISSSTIATQHTGDKDFGLLGASHLQMDFGSKFSLGGFGVEPIDTKMEAKTLAPRRDSLVTPTERRPRHTPSPKPGPVETPGSGIKMGDVDVDMDMKSALDRLMEDVAGAGAQPEDSMTTDEFEESFDHSRSITREDSPPFPGPSRPKVLERATADSVLMEHSEAEGIVSRTVSSSSTATLPPPPPPKDNIKSREQLILEKRREARRLEAGDDSDNGMEASVPRGKDRQSLGHGRPSRRRSMSTGDAEVLKARKRAGESLLHVAGENGDDLLADSIEKELKKLSREPSKKNKQQRYQVRERETTIYASSSDEKVSHMAGAGDLDSGRAWRTVRRPSDMNEYAKQIKEYRAQDKGKAYGKVFVKVHSIRGMNLPLPQQPTALSCTLNNGIHFVTTPEVDLNHECRINQEFELIEHSKLEFTLTLKIRRDPHIITQYKALTPSPAAPPPLRQLPPPVIQPPASKSYGMRSFFSSSPKKSSKEKIAAQQAPPPPPPPQTQPLTKLPDNLARYLKPDGTLARAFISFKDVANRCDTRLFETSYPLIGQRVEVGGKYTTVEVGEIVLQIFRLPPLPGIPQDQLPQSLDECHRGLRHINWHKVTYFQGTLTQNGGDCSTWRRRQFRVIGSNLVAFNDVTKRATATIDLKKAVGVEDNERSHQSPDEDDALYGVERSFRLIFPQNQEILFFADTDEEKSRWLDVLRALVGHIPPHPLWAELLWQRQEELAKRTQTTSQTILPPSAPRS